MFSGFVCGFPPPDDGVGPLTQCAEFCQGSLLQCGNVDTEPQQFVVDYRCLLRIIYLLEDCRQSCGGGGGVIVLTFQQPTLSAVSFSCGFCVCLVQGLQSVGQPDQIPKTPRTQWSRQTKAVQYLIGWGLLSSRRGITVQ